jgi:hypothetical protein
MSLSNIENTHWTVQACFVTSLTTGVLSVFFSCAANPALHGLHSATDIKDFLTKPTPYYQRYNFEQKISFAIKRQNEEPWNAEELRQCKRDIEQGKWQIASPYAAIMLVAPIVLLRIALNAFLCGLGIYLGILSTTRLIPTYGSGSSAILALYLGSSLFGLIIYYGAQTRKHAEHRPLARWHRSYDEYIKRVNDESQHKQEDCPQSPNDIDVVQRTPHTEHHQTTPKNTSRQDLEAVLVRQEVAGESTFQGRTPIDEFYVPQANPSVQSVAGNVNPPSVVANSDRESQLHSTTAEETENSAPSVPKGESREETHTPAEQTPKPQREHSPKSPPENLHLMLRILIKAQEDNLRATRQLLEMCGADLGQPVLPQNDPPVEDPADSLYDG